MTDDPPGGCAVGEMDSRGARGGVTAMTLATGPCTKRQLCKHTSTSHLPDVLEDDVIIVLSSINPDHTCSTFFEEDCFQSHTHDFILWANYLASLNISFLTQRVPKNVYKF